MAKKKAKKKRTAAARPSITAKAKQHRMSPLDWLVFILVIIGGLNWGLTGIGMLAGRNMNVVNFIFGTMPGVEAVIYVIVGICALYGLLKVVQIH